MPTPCSVRSLQTNEVQLCALCTVWQDSEAVSTPGISKAADCRLSFEQEFG